MLGDHDRRGGGTQIGSMVTEVCWTELAVQGFTTHRLIGEPALGALRAIVSSLEVEAMGRFVASPAHVWGERAAALQRECLPHLVDALDSAVPGHRPFLVAATVKGPGGGPVEFHQDWTYTDERVARPVFLWIPLVDVDERNGVLGAVAGSHLCAPETIRPSRGVHAPQFAPERMAAFAARATWQPLRAGEAMVFDPATLHASGPNRTDEFRPAITVALVPEGVDLVHFCQDEAGALTGFGVEDAFFVDNDYGTPPDRTPDLEPWWRAITDADFDRLVAAPPTVASGATG